MNKRILLSSVLFLFANAHSQDEDLDLDAMWDNTVWNEIENVADEGYEVEKVTAVAGVRGAEAEDEALHHLYYRQSMKGPSKIELNKALKPILEKYMTENNIDIVMDRKSIVVAKTEIDLTDKILKLLDKELKSINLK